MGKFNSKEQKIQEEKYVPRNLSLLDTDVEENIFSFVKNECSELSSLNHSFYNHPAIKSDRLRKIGQKLLRAISKGDETTVRNMLAFFKNTNPARLKAILSQKLRFQDPVDLIFHSVTPCQLAAFYLDPTMRTLIKSFMEPNDIISQLKELDENGLNYDMARGDFERLQHIAPTLLPPVEEKHNGEWVTLNEKHYDWCFRVYNEACRVFYLADQARNAEYVISGNFNNRALWNAREQAWIDIGFTQLFFPLPFINAYCSPLSFDEPPDFEIENIARTVSVSVTIEDEKRDIPSEWFENQKLGMTETIIKDSNFGRAYARSTNFCSAATICIRDHNALDALYTFSTADYAAFLKNPEAQTRKILKKPPQLPIQTYLVFNNPELSPKEIKQLRLLGFSLTRIRNNYRNYQIGIPDHFDFSIKKDNSDCEGNYIFFRGIQILYIQRYGATRDNWINADALDKLTDTDHEYTEACLDRLSEDYFRYKLKHAIGELIETLATFGDDNRRRFINHARFQHHLQDILEKLRLIKTRDPQKHDAIITAHDKIYQKIFALFPDWEGNPEQDVLQQIFPETQTILSPFTPHEPFEQTASYLPDAINAAQKACPALFLDTLDEKMYSDDDLGNSSVHNWGPNL